MNWCETICARTSLTITDSKKQFKEQHQFLNSLETRNFFIKLISGKSCLSIWKHIHSFHSLSTSCCRPLTYDYIHATGLRCCFDRICAILIYSRIALSEHIEVDKEITNDGSKLSCWFSCLNKTKNFDDGFFKLKLIDFVYFHLFGV